MRPVDLAREHGLSSQAVRNYEELGALPPAERSPAGHRRYAPAHAAALHAFLALRRAAGHQEALEIMRALNTGRLDAAFARLDEAHAQLLRDRETLRAVEQAVSDLEQEVLRAREAGTPPGIGPSQGRALHIGELARRLRVSPATLRSWEGAGVLRPGRERPAGHRVYGPQEVRDAELAHLLRRSGHGLDGIASVLAQMRGLRDAAAAHDAARTLSARLRARGLALLDASARTSAYLAHLPTERQPPPGSRG